ncbi:MAG: ABC transporter substrate-binding protein [Firmicutes bacterium]|nr:ABC transporter substrate-binding protein [Bacillota bacterium]
MRAKAKLVLVFAVAVTMLFSSMAAAKYNEAPVFGKLVAEGKLPPVEERLPKEPLVVTPVDEVGQYGGVWRRVATGPNDVQLHARLSFEALVRWNADGSDIMPNVAKSWDVSEDNRVFTFYLREGMKWSDGHPFTAADIEFYWNQVILNEDLTPVAPMWLCREGNLAEFRVIDDYTIQWEFSHPYRLFLRMLAYWGETMTQYPKHYLSQFHPDFVDIDTLTEMAKKEQREAWFQLFEDRRELRRNVDVPVITAWKTTVPPPAMTLVAEHNPYYWKVDTAGNQLPYIHKMHHDIVDNLEILNLKAATGEVDMQLRHILIDNLPVFAENAEQYGFQIFQWLSAEGSNYMLYPNYFHKDLAKREVFRDTRFRRALSLAIDRDEINNLVYLGLGRPRQVGAIPVSPFYEEGVDELYATRDVDEANRLLDEIGMSKRDSEGYRLLPNGEKFTVTIIHSPVFGNWARVSEMIVDYWSQIGIRTVVNVVERTLFEERSTAADFDYAVWTSDRGLTPDVEPVFLLPGRGQAVNSPWVQWLETNGVKGEAPPEGPMLEGYETYKQVLDASSDEEIATLMKRLIYLCNSEQWFTGVVGDLPHIVIVTNEMRNVPKVAVSDWLQKTPANTWPEQYYKVQK